VNTFSFSWKLRVQDRLQIVGTAVQVLIEIQDGLVQGLSGIQLQQVVLVQVHTGILDSPALGLSEMQDI
jgi:hypothetical protein